MTGGRDTISLSSDELEVSLLPGKGCDIVSLVDRRSGVDVLFRSPWGRRDAAGWGAAGTSSIERWVEAYPGGWQVLLPNGGDECIEGGVTWGYHGEAALARWSVLDSGPSRAVLETRLFTVPLHLRREILVAGRVVRLEERVSNESEQDLEVMWGHHPAFGAPFLEGGCLISAGCESVLADPDAPGTILAPRSRHRWPHARTAAGEPIDLSVVPGPGEKRAVLAYLGDFSDG
ncbi:MAG TPA: hypothetical protein VMD59_10915, partial [Acidimicrobiales bacterium]|nr:hypothetical protein [Acidimicrobiales bacterium]